MFITTSIFGTRSEVESLMRTIFIFTFGTCVLSVLSDFASSYLDIARHDFKSNFPIRNLEKFSNLSNLSFVTLVISVTLVTLVYLLKLLKLLK